MLKIIGFLSVFMMYQQTVQASPCNSVKSVEWLLGNWKSKNSEHLIKESWKQISIKTYEGNGQTYSIKKNMIISSETLRIVEMSGEVFYFAKVASNTLPVAFKLTNCTTQTVTFENLLHDFPKKISYQLNKDKSMTVNVTGEKESGFSIDFIGDN